MQHSIQPSHASVFFEWHCPVCWVSCMIPTLQMKKLKSGEDGCLSQMTESLLGKSRTRSQVQCSFNPEIKNFTIYSGHSFLNTPSYLPLVSCHNIYFILSKIMVRYLIIFLINFISIDHLFFLQLCGVQYIIMYVYQLLNLLFYGAGYSSNFLPNNYPFSGKQSNKLSHFCKTNVIVHRELKPHDV